MCMKQHFTLFKFTLWSLLSIWTAFGLCEFSEAVELLDEITTEDATHQDLDEETLAQLASSMKSDMPVFDAFHFPSYSIAPTSATPSLSAVLLVQWTCLVAHGPPFLPLYQQFSVYRI